MASIDVRDATLSYDRAGAGPILVWGHGLTSSRSSEDELGLLDWDGLRGSGIDIVRYDARGHGESAYTPAVEDYGWDRMALDQLALADALGIDRYVAGGASMGAATALHVACVAPGRVAGLVLMIPPTAWETRAAQVEVYETMASIIDAKGVEPLIAAGADVAPPDPFVGLPDWRERSIRSLRTADPVRLAGVFRGAATADFPPRDRVAAVAVPVLVLAWTGDPGHPVSTADELAALLPDVDVHLASTRADLDGWGDRIAAFVSGLA